jgi:hypothetical protein
LRTSGTLNALSGSGRAAASSASAGGPERRLGGRAAAQHPLGLGRPPRPGRHPAPGDPHVPDRAVDHVERGGDRGDRERVRRAVADLAVARTGSQWRQRHRGDQRAGRQHGLHLRGVAGQRVQAGQRDRRGLVQVHLGVQRGQRDGQVGRVGGDAVLGRAEDAEVAVRAGDGRAAGAGRTLVAGLGDVLEVAAPGALQQVAAIVAALRS